MSQAQQPTIMITAGLATAIMMYLKNGGDRLTGDLLAEQLQIQANAPQTAAEQQMAFNAAVEAAVLARTKGAVVVSQEELTNPDGIDRSDVRISPKRGSSSRAARA